MKPGEVRHEHRAREKHQQRGRPRRQHGSLYSAGFHLIPLDGEDGKKPLLRSWHESKRLPLPLVEDRMRRIGSLTYGIRLDGLMVVDLDTDNDATREYFANRFDQSPIVVATGRGSHHLVRTH